MFEHSIVICNKVLYYLDLSAAYKLVIYFTNVFNNFAIFMKVNKNMLISPWFPVIKKINGFVTVLPLFWK